MEHRREAEVTRDPETGRVTGYVERIEEKPRKKGGGAMLFGLLLGALLVAGGVAIYANNQGSYQRAGATIDSQLAQTETQARKAVGDASQAVGGAAESAGDAAQRTGDNVQRSLQ